MHICVLNLQLHRSGREIRLWHAGLSMDGWDVALPREQGYERRDTPASNDQDMSVVRASRPSEGEAKRQKTTSDSGTAIVRKITPLRAEVTQNLKKNGKRL